MKDAILILAHKNIPHLHKLLRYFDDDFCIFIHWDKKNRLTREERIDILQQPNVINIFHKYKITWGSINFLKAELFLLQEAMRYGTFRYFHLISGQDYPTKSLSYFKNFFSINNGFDFIEYKSLPRNDWENNTLDRFCYFIPCEYLDGSSKKGNNRINTVVSFQKRINIKRRIPKQFEILYGGENWFSLMSDSVKYILEYTKEKPGFLRRLRYTFAADESYFQSILLNSEKRSKIINNNLRYIEWQFRNNSFPANLDISDYFLILQSDVFFARKFEYPISIDLIRILDKMILFK